MKQDGEDVRYYIHRRDGAVYKGTIHPNGKSLRVQGNWRSGMAIFYAVDPAADRAPMKIKYCRKNGRVGYICCTDRDWCLKDRDTWKAHDSDLRKLFRLLLIMRD